MFFEGWGGMFCLDYPVGIINDSGQMIGELDATVYYSLVSDGFGSLFVCVDYFECKVLKGDEVVIYSLGVICPMTLMIFLRGKESLEGDSRFIARALANHVGLLGRAA
ncbi:MAG: hypothetical protein JSC189_000757 [Candidatus Tokpelaia sp. JSC189]|nr:MAG: hypothetical protein JSC189_000757 [Candidatus Tokpelaia sp. JSC189]